MCNILILTYRVHTNNRIYLGESHTSYSMEKAKSSTIQGNKPLSVIIISFIYSTINELTSEITFATTAGSGHINFGIFVPASAAILFGKGVGAGAAGLGGLLTEIQRALFTDQSSGLDYNVLINSLSNALGAYLTGFLTQVRDAGKRTLQESMKNSREIRRILQQSVGALVGMSMVASFADSYLVQLKNGDPLIDASPDFLGSFFASAIVIIFSIPITLFLLSWVEKFLQKRGITADILARDITWEVSDPGDAEIENVELPDHAFLYNKWTSMKFHFKNKTGRETSFTMECVATAQVYPPFDTSRILQPDESWTQEFYILPGKQKTVDIRIRTTPSRPKEFKGAILDDAITEITGKVLDPNKNSLGLMQFGGVNFSVVGISIVWQDIVNAVQHPRKVIDTFGGNTAMIAATALIETLTFVPLMAIYYKIQKNKVQADGIKLAFSQDLESHGYQEKAGKKTMELLLKYQRFFGKIIQVLIVLATLASIGFIGYEGFRTWDDPNYQTKNPEYILYGSFLIIVIWIVSIWGMELLNGLGLKNLPPWVLRPGKVILDFKPTKPFQEGIANEVIVMAQNPTNQNGLRIVFQGQDTVSPSIVEVHAKPGEIVNFKIAVTPLHKETSDILAVAYPFFDENGVLLDFDEAEPIARQDINYVTFGQTKMGLTQEQQKRLFQFGGIGAAFGILVTFIQQLFPDYPEIAELIKQSGPYLAALQAPFIYGYFFVQNKLAGSKIKM